MRGRVGIFSGFLDRDVAAYIAAVETADGNTLEQGVKDAYNNFIVGLKADGIWNNINSACILMGARTLSGSLIPLRGTAPTSVNFVTGDYNRKTGLVGNKTNKYLNSNVASNLIPQNNNHHAIFIQTIDSGGGSGFYFNAGFASSGTTTLVRNAATNRHNVRNKSASTDVVGPVPPVAGFFGVDRSASGSYIARTNNTDTTITNASVTSVTVNYFIFAGNNAGTPSTYTNSRLQYYTFGNSITMSAYENRLTTLASAISAAIP